MMDLRNIDQPKGGFLPLTRFKKTKVQDIDADFSDFQGAERGFVLLAAENMLRITFHERPDLIFEKEKEIATDLDELVYFEKLLDDCTVPSVLQLTLYSQLKKKWCSYKSPRFYKPTEQEIKFVTRYVAKTKKIILSMDQSSELDVFSFEGLIKTDKSLWLVRMLNRQPTERHTLHLLAVYQGLNYSKEKSYIQMLRILNLGSMEVYSLETSKIDSQVLEDSWEVLTLNGAKAKSIDQNRYTSSRSAFEEDEIDLSNVATIPASGNRSTYKKPNLKIDRFVRTVFKIIKKLLFIAVIAFILWFIYRYISLHTDWIDQGIEQFKAIGNQLQLDTIFQ